MIEVTPFARSTRGSLAIASALLIFGWPTGLSAAARITEGLFAGCFYGNRGGQCSFQDAEGQEHAIAMPVNETGVQPNVTWVIDGKALGFVPMDGGFLVPDHPSFLEDHAIGTDKSDHPLLRCKVKLIERPSDSRVILDTAGCP
jgi:hypothetical protein